MIMSHKTIDITCTNKLQSLNGLKVPNNNVLMLWFKEIVQLFYLNSKTTKDVRCFAILKLPCMVIDVAIMKNNIICLAEKGLIYVSQLSEESCEKQEQILEYRELKFAKDVLCISGIVNGFAMLRRCGDVVVLKLTSEEFEMSDFSHFMTYTIPCKYSCISLNNDNHISVFRSSDFHPKFASLLFRETAIIDCDILFIAVENGHVLWLPVLSGTTNDDFSILHSGMSPIRGVIAAGDEQSKKYDRIMILNSDGSVVVIRCDTSEIQLNYDILYFPSSLKSFCLVKENFFHSDGLNLWCSQMVGSETGKLNFVTQLLPIKGVVGLASRNNGKNVVVGCRHTILYIIDCLSLPSESKEDGNSVQTYRTTEEDGSLLLSKMQLVAHEMSSLREALTIENKVLHEISIAARADLFKNMIRVKVEVDNNFCYPTKETFIVKVTNKSLQEFSEEFWSFNIHVSSRAWNINSLEKFDSSLKLNGTLTFCISAESCEFTLPVIVDCSFVLILSGNTLGEKDNKKFQCLEVPLQRQYLGITHFLSPILDESLTNIQDCRIDREESWKRLLQRFRSVSEDYPPRTLGSHRFPCYSFKLPEITSWASLIEETLKNSRQKFPHVIKDDSLVKFRIRDSTVSFQYQSESHSVKVLSSDKNILKHLKDYIINAFLLGSELVSDDVVFICLDESDLIRAQNLKLVFELEHVSGMLMEKLKCLKEEVREFVNSRLPS